MNPILMEDLLGYRFLSGITVSPFENRAVFTVAVQDARSNGYKKNLWQVDPFTGKTEKLTSHGKAGAVDHAADVALEGDIVEVILCGLGLLGILLGKVAELLELFVTEEAGEILGTMMLREEQERNARSAPWQLPLEEQEQLTIYTFAVRPDCRGGGVGRALLGYAEAWAKAQGKRALRLDVHEINTPAIKLYESCGFRYIATVDLGYGAYGLKWFRLYEKLL